MSGRLGVPTRLLAVAAVVILMLSGPAAADPAGPTDYRTEVVAIDPTDPAVTVDILGGDSFVQLAVEPGSLVEVVGYRGEPYLRFAPDGTVEQNDRSSSRWLNDDRYGESEIPPQADDEAEPEWIVVASDGVHAWHDHRAHWMNPDRPIGAEPGDTILEAVIPLSVDGRTVDLVVRSELLAGPSPLPAIVGGLASLVAMALAAVRRQRRAPRSGRASADDAPVEMLVVVGLVALAATAVGWAAVTGLPGEAAPGPVWWLLPLVAGAVTLGAILVVVRGLLAAPLRALVVPGALAVAGVELVVWAWLRRTAVIRALIPTQAPEWLDRMVVTGAAATGLVALAAAGYLMIGQLTATAPRPEPRPSR